MWMKRSILSLLAVLSVYTHAQSCGLGAVSESNMHLISSYKSQAATSFHVDCDQAYSIRFNSMNLSSRDGASYVSNGAYRLKTHMNIIGAKSNEWNVPLTAQAGGLHDKYIIAVQLMEQPSTRIPAGIYRDVIYVNLSF